MTNSIKSFRCVIYSLLQKARVFLTFKHFRPSLIFVGESCNLGVLFTLTRINWLIEPHLQILFDIITENFVVIFTPHFLNHRTF